MIANALHESNVADWVLPTPSAFDEDEIDAIARWVEAGGALLLIADHMPFPGAVAALAERFGLLLGNGYALPADESQPLTFTREDDSLRDHVIVDGRDPSERVERVMTFTGQAFRLAPGSHLSPLLVFGEAMLVMTPRAGTFDEMTPRLRADGMLQGAVGRFEAGRIAMFGEAAMFTAQLAGEPGQPVGMNDPRASGNVTLTLNLLRWLSGALDDRTVR